MIGEEISEAIITTKKILNNKLQIMAKRRKVKTFENRTQFILATLRRAKNGRTCQQLSNAIADYEGLTPGMSKYLSGSISTKLSGLVYKGVLRVSKRSVGPLGGKIYHYVK